jgi:fibronectin type 3 domain-containing protein
MRSLDEGVEFALIGNNCKNPLTFKVENKGIELKQRKFGKNKQINRVESIRDAKKRSRNRLKSKNSTHF